jgi:hypothetical protein
MQPLWPQTVHKGADGVLQIGGLSVTELAQRFGNGLWG